MANHCYQKVRVIMALVVKVKVIIEKLYRFITQRNLEEIFKRLLIIKLL